MQINSTHRFSNRVDDYVKYRPSYPPTIISLLQEKYQLKNNSRIADIGSGTGISSALFLDAGYEVIGVEPNKEMRDRSVELLANYTKFEVKDGTAENTELEAHSIDVIVAGQAFHWFDRLKTKKEFQRILAASGKVILLWNERLTQTPFEKDYDELIVKHGIDYVSVDHRNIDEQKIQTFFEPGACAIEVLANWQIFDFEGLKGRLLSSSYMPSHHEAGYEEMVGDLRLLFDRYQQNGEIRINYETKLYIGSFR
ncbi:class I SAM-dependent methyltransferase [Olivibacter sp. SDN3]|uniref:class I SAM-dependent methyltransferase n=1 Tax=Olivibacter sp. SDN3 TaxID=2764720 RepID=UPI001651658D|nr:class I SAM-dependent methyltransferase [Olivibacter sp. SDN3]QNL48263.1 class I SAM-dependent methyltransferase [Olivibacter sp. SDN3]